MPRCRLPQAREARSGRYPSFAESPRVTASSSRALLRLGFRARTAIHPAQIPVINEVFTPAPDEVARARALVAAFDEAVRGGAGVLTGPDGRMVDVAVVRTAREVLARAERAAGSG